MKYHYNNQGEKKPCRATKQCRFNKNQTTVKTYNDKDSANKYIQATPNIIDGSIKKWLDYVHSQLDPQSKIFELGSATGRDAIYLQKLGHKVDVSDVSTHFINKLKDLNFAPYKFNALTDNFPPKKYNLILANAVLLHFEQEDTKKFLKKTYEFLKSGNKIAFTLKRGEGEEWSDVKMGKMRYFSYWNEKNITNVLTEIGFRKTNVHIEDDNGTQWLQIIAVK